jgi:LPXTG-motif cell wall-anchored protein
VGEFLPTAAPCSNQPTILALNANFINVRSGPGTVFATVGRLLYQEVRPIIGRDAAAPWWLIQLGNGQTGWVADEVVQVQGNTAAVPIVPAPLLNNATVTPGAPWQPTTPPPCATPVTATPTAIPTAGETMVVAPLETAVETAYPVTIPEPVGQTNVLSAAVTPTPTTTAIALPTSIAALPQPGMPPAPVETSVDSTGTDYSGLLLVGAALLLVAGTAVFLIKRRS